MNRNSKFGRLFFILLIVLLGVSPVAAEGGAPLERFALIIGTNNGGSERVMLRYATSDAESIARVLNQLGAVPAENMELLLNPDVAEIKESLLRLKVKVSAADHQAAARTELMVYYSGHSNEEGLLINEELYEYKVFREAIKEIPVDVRVAILDSCSSGSFTRTKGGVRKPAFLIDAANEMSGYAFLTSSAEDEAAQESDSIEGSFFTHYLVSGLRGAADVTRDKIVTLNEAYSYAYKETLSRTEKTQFGAQHPKYDIQLTGTGDLILTDIRSIDAGIVFPPEMEGRFFVRDEAGSLVAELNKLSGHPVELGVEPGQYTVIMMEEKKVSQTFISVQNKNRVELKANWFKRIDKESTIARGDEKEPEKDLASDFKKLGEDMSDFGTNLARDIIDSIDEGFEDAGFFERMELWKDKKEKKADEEKEEEAPPVIQDEPAEMAVEYRPFHISLMPDISSFSGSGSNRKVITNFSLNALVGSVEQIQGSQFSGIGSFIRYDLMGSDSSGIFSWISGSVLGLQISGIFNYAFGDITGVQLSSINIAASNIAGAQIGGVACFAGGSVTGAQLSGTANISSGRFTGFQGSGTGNYSGGDFIGAQLSGVINIGDASLTGLQGAGLINYLSGGFTGAQFSGAANIASGDISLGVQAAGVLNSAGDIGGCQFGGVVNIAEDLFGLQAGGVVNIAKDVYGLQTAGVVNIAENVAGCQIGLINIADNYIGGLPVGLINIEGSGENRIALWADQEAAFNLDLRFGTKFSYTLLTAGAKYDTDPLSWTLGMGYGLTLPLNWLHLYLDASANYMFRGLEQMDFSGAVNILPVVKTMAAFDILGRFAIFAGLSAKVEIPGFNSHLFGPISEEPMAWEYPYFNLRPRLIAGIQF